MKQHIVMLLYALYSSATYCSLMSPHAVDHNVAHDCEDSAAQTILSDAGLPQDLIGLVAQYLVCTDAHDAYAYVLQAKAIMSSEGYSSKGYSEPVHCDDVLPFAQTVAYAWYKRYKKRAVIEKEHFMTQYRAMFERFAEPGRKRFIASCMISSEASPLHCAVTTGDWAVCIAVYDLFCLLFGYDSLSSGRLLEETDRWGNGPLFYACLCQEPGIIRFMRSLPGFDPNGDTSLYDAVDEGDVDTVRDRLKHSPFPNGRLNHAGQTAYGFACHRGWRDDAEEEYSMFLRTCGIQRDPVLLHWRVAGAMLKIFIEAAQQGVCIDFNVIDKHGNTKLMDAVHSTILSDFDMLLAAQQAGIAIDLNKQNGLGNTILHTLAFCIRRNGVARLKKVIALGAHYDLVNNHKETALALLEPEEVGVSY